MQEGSDWLSYFSPWHLVQCRKSISGLVMIWRRVVTAWILSMRWQLARETALTAVLQEEKEMSFDLEFCNLDVRRAMNGHPLEAHSYRDKEKPALSPTCKIFWWEGCISFGIFWEIYLSVYNVSWGWSLGEMPPVTWEQKSCFVLKEGRNLLGLNVQGTPEYVHGGEKGEEWTQRKVERKAVSESWVVLSHWAWLKHGWDLQGDGWSSHH